MSNPSPRAAVYLRISQDPRDDGLAVDRQREDCYELAAGEGWTVAAEFADVGSAFARNAKRPRYDEMVREFEAGRFDALICWDLDRLTRQPRQLEDWLDRATAKGLRVVTANGNVDLSTPGGRSFARGKINSAITEMEQKSFRQRRANKQRAVQGKGFWGGPRPTGYTNKGEIVPPEASTVASIFEAFASGESLRGIVRDLNSRGVPSRRGPWTPSSVSSILLNPRYAGIVMHRGELLPDVEPTWEPIVDRELFAVVGARLSDPRRRNQVGTDRKYLGSGLYRCGPCGAPLISLGQSRYACKANGCLHRRTDPIDRLVVRTVELILADGSFTQSLADDKSAEIESLVAAARKITLRLETLKADYASELITGREYRDFREAKEAELGRIQAELATQSTGPAGGVLSAPDPVEAFRNAQRESLNVARATIAALVDVAVHRAPQGRKAFDDSTVTITPKGKSQPVVLT